MLFLILLGLATVLGVRSEECEGRISQCMKELTFSESSIRAYDDSGNVFPSNAFFVENCDAVLKHVRCVRAYDEECEDLDIVADTAAALRSVTEFCDETTDLRKGYAANVDCLNRLNVTNHLCFTTALETSGNLYWEHSEIFKEKEIDRPCLDLHLFGPCTVELLEESCGEDAGQTASDFLDRIQEIYYCTEDDMAAIGELLAELLAEVDDELD